MGQKVNFVFAVGLARSPGSARHSEHMRPQGIQAWKHKSSVLTEAPMSTTGACQGSNHMHTK